MNCPACNVPMIRGEKMPCRTGDAQKFVCPRCRKWQWQQISTAAEIHFRPVAETNRKILAAARTEI
jgi:transposase-like protein